jgi:hypothetical protein
LDSILAQKTRILGLSRHDYSNIDEPWSSEIRVIICQFSDA